MREISDPLTGLVKAIDRRLAEVTRPKDDDKLGVWIVFCNEDPDLKQKLLDLVAKEGLKQVVVCGAASAPARYKVAPEADVTVVVYSDSRRVTANFPFRKGDLKCGHTAEVLKAIDGVLPK